MAELEAEIGAFNSAARWVHGVIAAVSDEAWDGPGLGAWDLRALVGHASRALLTVEQYLARPAGVEDVDSAVAYYERVTEAEGADSPAVLQRGIDAGAALGEQPSRTFQEIMYRVTALLPGQEDVLIGSLAGGIRLSEYLPTRTFELVVHGLDIASAVGAPAYPPEGAVQRSLAIASELAVRSGRGAELLLGMTGRTGLPQDFTVIGRL